MSLKIGYFGSPEHSKKLLEILINEGCLISFVVTNIDKPVGRKQILSPTPVKVLADENQIPVFQSPKLRTDIEVQNKILEIECDLHIVYAYGSIIPSSLFGSPKYGSINLHGSVLPKYRGASPVQSSLLNGDLETGFTIQYLAEEVDSGDILSKFTFPIGLTDTTGTLLSKITDLGGKELLRLVRIMEEKKTKLPATPQIASEATHCRKIKAEDRPIDWTRSSVSIHNQIRALNPDPFAYTHFREKKILILSSFLPDPNSEVVAVPEGAKPGSFFLHGKKRLFCLCGDGNLLGIESLIPEGKKAMFGFEFFNGARAAFGENFT